MARERIDYVDGPCLASAIRSGAEWVASKRIHLNEINVFPVPDGDTGTNLTMTLKAAADAIRGLEDRSLGEVSAALSRAVLLGARGNAGVILAQFIRGFSREVHGIDRLYPRGFIEALQSLSRVQTRGQAFAPVATKSLIETVMATASAEETGVELCITTELPTVTVDAGQLRQLFAALIDNALKFRRTEPPCIAIAARRRGRAWHFEVQDNGIGIDRRYADKIFGVFQRLHTRDEYPGTGIGLAVCKRIVERHGGRIWVESEFDQGSTFYFTIPQKREPLVHPMPFHDPKEEVA